MTQTESYVLRQGPPGKRQEVTIIDEGEKMKIVLGGKALFREWDHNLTAEGRDLLRELAPDLRGYRNKLEIRGHTASADFSQGGQYASAWNLSYLRALAVKDFLVEEGELNQRRFRVVACGDTEPLKSNLLPGAREANRRVEVVMTEELATE